MDITDKKTMTFHDLQEMQKEWAAHNFPNSTPIQPFMGLVEEVGELSHSLLKREQNIRGSYEAHTAAIEDAIGDILVYLADVCTKNNISMQHAIEITWEEVSQRDWIKFPYNGVTK